jgi:hypothetical protein
MTDTQAKDTTELKTGILKSLWSRGPNGRWGVTDMKGIYFRSKPGFDGNYFAFESEMTLMTTRPSQNFHEMTASFGSTDFLMKQSVVPVVAWNEGDTLIRCIGTASIISCSGLVLTAAHVVMDPYESGYGASLVEGQMKWHDGFNLGVLIPINPAFGGGERFFPFEGVTTWGNWIESPMITEKDKFEYLTDIAICKIPGMPDGAAHQPLNMSLNPFVPGEMAYALGYAKMEDVPLVYRESPQHSRKRQKRYTFLQAKCCKPFRKIISTRVLRHQGPVLTLKQRFPVK